MSAAQLPPELRFKIAQHLEDSLESTFAIRETGCNLSLVSRTWREIGTRMCWRSYDSGCDDADRASRHPRLLGYVKACKILCDDQEETQAFVEGVWTHLDHLEELDMTILDIEVAEPLMARICAPTCQLAPLKSLGYFLDTTSYFSANRALRAPPPPATLLQILPNVPNLEHLTLRLRTPFRIRESENVARLPKLERLLVDIPVPDSEVEMDFAKWDQSTCEATLRSVLLVPEPARLRNLFISHPHITSFSLATIERFHSLTSFTLRLFPPNLKGILDTIPALVGRLSQLSELSVLGTHVANHLRPFAKPSRTQLAHFLESVPESVTSLTTHFDLSDPDSKSLVAFFLGRRVTSRLVEWTYYDIDFEANAISRRLISNEYVLKRVFRIQESAWETRPAHFIEVRTDL